MKKIISGKVDDTDTAKRLAHWDNGVYGSLDSISETLYRKKTGEYFVHGDGGAATCYARATGPNSWAGGERIMPMTFTEAKDWAEEKLTPEAYAKIFGEVTEDGTRMQVCYSLSVSTVETIKREAEKLGISASAYIERIVNG